MEPGAPAPAPASAGATEREATHRDARSSRRLVFSISPLPVFRWCQKPPRPLSDSRMVRDIQVTVKGDIAAPAPQNFRKVGASAGQANQAELLPVPLDDPFEDLADAGDVVLLLGLRLERTELARHDRLLEGAVRHRNRAALAEHVRLVQRLAGRVVLLPVAVAGLRVRRHDDPRLRAVDAREPRVARPDEAAVPPLERVLPEIPNVPVFVLRVVVERQLDRVTAFRDGVADNRRVDAEDVLLPS